jgi:hypothetical protein
MRARVVVAWWDFWVGAYWDRRRKRLFVFPFPMLGICIDFGGRLDG